MSEMEILTPGYLRLSVGRGLLGNVTANLAGFYVEISEKIIIINAYFFHAPSDKDQEAVREAATEIVADYPEGYMVEEHLGLISKVDVNEIAWDFLRAEVYEEET